MNALKEELYVIMETKDYSRFKFFGSNRVLRENNIAKLMKSFEQTGGMSKAKPIVVDTNYRIIDGQHRLEAARRTGSSVYYIVTKDKETTIPIYNTFQEKWFMDDYAKYWSNQGNDNYTRLLELANQCHTSLATVVQVLNLKSADGHFYDNFKQGRFIFEDKPEDCIKYVEKMIDFCALVRRKRVVSPKIVRAIRYLNRANNFDFDLLIARVNKHYNRIRPCDTTEDYIDMFAEIYNYRNSKIKLDSIEVARIKQGD